MKDFSSQHMELVIGNATANDSELFVGISSKNISSSNVIAYHFDFLTVALIIFYQYAFLAWEIVFENGRNCAKFPFAFI